MASLLASAPASASGPYSVTNTNDSGGGSLRDAINKANASAGLDAITFSIGSGAKTITPLTPLPALTDQVEILGNSQSGFAASPLIEINGSKAGSGANGLNLNAGAANSVIWALAIDGFSGDGIQVNGGGGTVMGDDWLGMNSSAGGTGNSIGVHIVSSPNNVVDGRICLLSCSTTYGIIVRNGVGVRIEGFASTGNVISRNLIGITHSFFGSTPYPNSTGVDVASSASSNRIGGTNSSDRNIISANIRNVLLENAAFNNVVEGNYVGTDFSGITAFGSVTGVQILAAGSNTIGGTATGAGNVISGNGFYGVFVCGKGSLICSAANDAGGNQIQGNLIGTTANGIQALGNGFSAPGGTLGAGGVYFDDATGNTVGGTASGAGNVISGNKQGVTILVRGALIGNEIVQGNLIGTDKNGTAALGNSNAGVQIGDSHGNLVGGGSPQARNIISGNAQGVQIIDFGGSAGLTATNRVEGNYIGTDITGTAAVPNALNGVSISGDASDNTIDSNVISGNGGIGLRLSGGIFSPSSNNISSNRIGTTAGGGAALANNGDGILDQALNNTFGSNLVSGNTGIGIDVQASGDTLIGNFIGTDVAGNAAVGNASLGASVAKSNTSLIGNVVSGNADDGVDLVGGPNNVLTDNKIGTNVTGTAALANNNGVFVTGSGNTVGSASTGNLISGNRANGIFVSTGGDGTTIQSNLIGTNAAGTAALGNVQNGVLLEGVAGTMVGGVTVAPGSAPGNVISGNNANGVEIIFPSGVTPGNSLFGNFIGLAASGMAAVANGGDGVLVSGVPANMIGGTGGRRNVISGNKGNGVDLTGAGATANKVQSNFIGTRKDGATAQANGGDGVLIRGRAGQNQVGGGSIALGNRILFNGVAGIFVNSGNRNAIHRNAIGSNVGLGIDLAPAGVNQNDAGDPDAGPNLRQNYPVVTSASSSGGNTSITGTLNSTPKTTGFTLEFFWSTACDPSGFGQGRNFIGVISGVSTDAAGNASFSKTFAGVSVPVGSFVTATATTSTGNTSEFSQCRLSATQPGTSSA